MKMRPYLVYGVLVIAMTMFGSLRGWSYWSLFKTGRWSPSGPKVYHK